MQNNAAGSSVLTGNVAGSSAIQPAAGSSLIQPASSSQSVAVGGIGGNANLTPQVAQNQSSINSSIAQTNNESATIASLLKSIQAEEEANAPGVAPSLNLNALNAQAQSQAQNTVNPLYTQYLNEYNQELAANQQAAQSQNTLNLGQEQSALGNTLAQNKLSQQAAASTNALTQGNINAEGQNYQLNSGMAQNQKLQSINQSIGSGNLGASGIGQQQLWDAANAKVVADAQQQGQFQYQRDTSNLSTQDTFAQLAQSSQYATTAEGQQEAQTNFNLNDYLRQASYNDSQYQQALAASRQQAVTAQTQQVEAQLVQQQLQALTGGGGKNYAAGESAYSNVLNPSMSLPSAPAQSDYLNAYGASV
jgi:hypothetical protein